jgi:phage portal protein BeeE
MDLKSLFSFKDQASEFASLADFEKLNPAQEQIAWAEGDSVPTTKRGITFNNAYQNMEVVGRGVDLIVNSGAEVNFDVKEKLPFTGLSSLKPKKIITLLNHRPNPYEDINSFRRKCYMDLIIEGNCFIYFDGEHLFNLPAVRTEIITDKKTYIKGYKYDGTVDYFPSEVIHIKDNSAD